MKISRKDGKTIEEREKQSKLVREVNHLIRKSFGPLYGGNRSIISYGVTLGSDVVNLDCLDKIIRNSLIFYRVIGSLNNDGSEIAIYEEKEKQAIKYAQLYEQKFGKGVTIKLI